MKKYYLLPALLCLLTVLSCASKPAKPQMTGSDEECFTKAMSNFRSGNYTEAIPIFEEIREKFPMSPYAVLAELRLGECHYFKDEFIEASHFFDNFRRLHPSNPQVAYSIYMRGMCAYQQILSLDRDQTFAEEAAEQFQQLYEIFPQSQYTGKALNRIADAKRQLAGREIFIGNFYMKKKDYAGAIERYNRALKRYPNQIKSDELLLLIGKATICKGDEKRGKKILEFMIQKYPDSIQVADAKAIIENPTQAFPPKKPMLQFVD
jgi:outer membrane protein assembly factor BamD